MSGEKIFKMLMKMDDKQRARLYHRIIGPDKSILIKITMDRFGIQFEPAEHIVELAIGNKDLTKLSLAEVSGLICRKGESMVKGDWS